MNIQSFTFGPFQENTFLLWDETSKGIVVDPGMYNAEEEKVFSEFVAAQDIILDGLWNTHAHIDHVMGNDFIFRKYGLKPIMHKKDLPTLAGAEIAANLYGLNYTPSPLPEQFVAHDDVIGFGNAKAKVLFVPGHAPGHVVFYFKENHLVINGDVLFDGSVGRVDLPGGDGPTLEKSIREVMYQLPDNTTVYCGHGGETSIGKEKRSNYFVWEGGSRL